MTRGSLSPSRLSLGIPDSIYFDWFGPEIKFTSRLGQVSNEKKGKLKLPPYHPMHKNPFYYDDQVQEIYDANGVKKRDKVDIVRKGVEGKCSKSWTIRTVRRYMRVRWTLIWTMLSISSFFTKSKFSKTNSIANKTSWTSNEKLWKWNLWSSCSIKPGWVHSFARERPQAVKNDF